MDIDNILLDLEIIKQLNSNNKLGVNIIPGSKKLLVDNTNYFSSVSRWYNGYNREDSITYLENLLDKINKNVELIIEGNHITISTTLKEALTDSLSGLNQLKITYTNDSISVAKITLIINKINVLIKKLDNINFNENNVTFSMLENIESHTLNTNE